VDPLHILCRWWSCGRLGGEQVSAESATGQPAVCSTDGDECTDGHVSECPAGHGWAVPVTDGHEMDVFFNFVRHHRGSSRGSSMG
jgi:hypothetical protein